MSKINDEEAHNLTVTVLCTMLEESDIDDDGISFELDVMSSTDVEYPI